MPIERIVEIFPPSLLEVWAGLEPVCSPTVPFVAPILEETLGARGLAFAIWARFRSFAEKEKILKAETPKKKGKRKDTYIASNRPQT
jgi:hypothetical protein